MILPCQSSPTQREKQRKQSCWQTSLIQRFLNEIYNMKSRTCYSLQVKAKDSNNEKKGNV